MTIKQFGKRSLVLGALLACTAIVGASHSTLMGQEPITLQPQVTQAQGNLLGDAANPNQPTTPDSAVLNTIDDKVTGGNVRVSQLVGMDIQNPAGEDIGEIDDLVIDARTGQLRYAAVTYGGFLGLGNKLFAVPFEAFKFQREPDDADDVVLILNITEKQLDASQGFDKDHWPNWTDGAFARDLDQRYGVERHSDNTSRNERGVDVNIGGRSGVDVTVD